MAAKKSTKKPKCPRCEGTQVRKQGTDTKAGGVLVQIWHCRTCGHKFRKPMEKKEEK